MNNYDTNTKFKQKLSICPDDFTGSDVEKLQACFDLGIYQNIHITINRDIDLTGYSINIDKGYTYFTFVECTRGASLIKSDAGFMFTSSYANNQRSNLRFNNVNFVGDLSYETYVINGDRMIRYMFNNCTFIDINGVKAETVIVQTLRITNCTIHHHNGFFLDAERFFDVHIIGNQIEANSTGGFCKASNASATTVGIYMFDFSHNLLEGDNVDSIFYVGNACDMLVISNNYLEAIQAGLIEIFNTANSGKFVQIVIKDNFIANAGTYIINGLDYVSTASKISIQDNQVNSESYFLDTSSLPDGININTSNNIYVNASGALNNYLVGTQYKSFNNNNSIKINHGDTPSITYSAGTGVIIEIDNYLQGARYKYPGHSMLISILCKESTYYVANYVGILSFVGVDVSGANKVRMNLTALFDDIGGLSEGSTCGVTATFGNGTDLYDNAVAYFSSKKIIFTLANLTSTDCEIFIKPFQEILINENSYLFRKKYNEYS